MVYIGVYLGKKSGPSCVHIVYLSAPSPWDVIVLKRRILFSVYFGGKIWSCMCTYCILEHPLPLGCNCPQADEFFLVYIWGKKSGPTCVHIVYLSAPSPWAQQFHVH